jgi:hypothetical protein
MLLAVRPGRADAGERCECGAGRFGGSEDRVEELAIGRDRLVERGHVWAVFGDVPVLRS